MDQNEQLMQMLMIMNPEMAQMMQLLNGMNNQEQVSSNKPKRATAYQRRYKAAFKKVSSRYKLKSGKWKKGGFKAAVKAAHAQAKKGGKK
jgi:hypothetical protein